MTCLGSLSLLGERVIAKPSLHAPSADIVVIERSTSLRWDGRGRPREARLENLLEKVFSRRFSRELSRKPFSQRLGLENFLTPWTKTR